MSINILRSIKGIRHLLFAVLNFLLPKSKRVVVVGFPNVETGAIETANFIASNYNLPVNYIVSSQLNDAPGSLLNERVETLEYGSDFWSQISYIWKLMTSKYIFATHGLPIIKSSRRQVIVNLWHGLLYKKIGKLIGGRGMLADVTVGTSPLTKKMLSKAFGVSEDSVLVSGYPRNDALIRSKLNSRSIKKMLGLGDYQKVIIWLPTFRKKAYGEFRQDGAEVDNPFYISNFNVTRFNQILSQHNCLCIVKPHPMAVKYDNAESLSNVIFIDDQWVSKQNITLYDLVGSTDLLISDVSSVVIDYLLTENPIFCVSEDFDTYKLNRGFYFSDIENWLPSPVIREESDLFEKLTHFLSSETDQYFEKRMQLKNYFFSHNDDQSTKRLVEHVLGKAN